MFELFSQSINVTTIINKKYNFRSHANPKLVHLLAAFGHMSQLQWSSYVPNEPLESLLTNYHSGVVSWHTVLNNTTSTMPKNQGGPFFRTLEEVKSYRMDHGSHYCRIDMPCTFALGDGLLFSVESNKMDTWQAANQHACFRAVAHMLAAAQLQVKLAADRRHVRLMESHWNISIKDLRERITVVLHQFPVAASSSFERYPAASNLAICNVIGCNFQASKPHPEVDACFICDRHLQEMAQHKSPATEPHPSVAAAASSHTMLPKPLAVEPPSIQADWKELLGDNRQLRKPKQMTAATASEHDDGTLAADVLEQCSPASGREKAAQKAATKELQSRTLSTLAPIAEATIAFGDTEAPIADATIPDSYLENMD
jgi:hypothetical protein